MKFACLYLIMLTLSGYALAGSMPKFIERSQPLRTGNYQYSGYDGSGRKILNGRLTIISVQPHRNKHEDSYEIKGYWRLNKIGDPKMIGPQTGTGELVGSIDKGEIHIDLNPHMSDNNVTLQGKIEGRRFHGTWRYSGFAGSISEGTFEATRK